MGKVIYTSRIRIERVRGPLRRAYVPVEPAPILFGVHGAVARHYYPEDMAKHEPHATTLDYVVAATGGALIGSFGANLEGQGIPAGEGRLTAETFGDVEDDDGVLVIKRIHVRYHLRLRAEQREAAEREHVAHLDECPMFRTLKGAVDVTTELELEVDG